MFLEINDQGIHLLLERKVMPLGLYARGNLH